MHANHHNSGGQDPPDIEQIQYRQAMAELQRFRASAPKLRDLVDPDLVDKLHPVERGRLILDQPVCLAERLNMAGLHHVTMIRLSGNYAGQMYLDDRQQTEAFVMAAVDRLCLEGEDPNAVRNEFRRLVGQKLAAYEEHSDRVVIESLSEVMPAEVEWLWPGYLAADKLAVLVGEPGVGKTLTALDIAARVTSGAPWPTDPPDTEPREPASVILLSEMDDSADTLSPRLEAMGADHSRVHLVRSYVQPRESVAVLPFSVGGGLDMLPDCIERVPDCRLVIIDPLSLYVEGTLNRSQITELLGDLIELAADKEVAILVVSYFGRSQVQYASPVTAKFVAAARTVWRIVDDGHDYGRRVLFPLKNNLGTDHHGLAFRIQEVDDLVPAPKVVWETKQLEIAVQRSTYQLDSSRLPSSRQAYRTMVHQWLRNQLDDGERFAQDVLDAAKVAGIGAKTLRKVLREIGGMIRKESTGLWIWQLTDQASNNSAHHNCACHIDRIDHIDRLEMRQSSPLTPEDNSISAP